jgi:hypothetical protein
MKNAGIDEASVLELKLQLQQYIAKLKINSDEEHRNDHYDQDLYPVVDTNLLAFDEILLDAIDDAKKPRSWSISDQIRENSLINDHDNVQDDDDYRYQLDSDGYDCGSDSSDGDDYSTEDEDKDDGDDMVIDDEDGADDDEDVEYFDQDDEDGDDDDEDVEYFEQDDEENEDDESDAYLTEEEWQDILARYKKPAVTELERERERLYSLFEDYDVEKAEMIDDLDSFKQMR